jgi:hypothetical protein
MFGCTFWLQMFIVKVTQSVRQTDGHRVLWPLVLSIEVNSVEDVDYYRFPDEEM